MSRLVNFRLSDEDIAALDAAVKTEGAKDRTDWLRVKIRTAGSLQQDPPSEPPSLLKRGAEPLTPQQIDRLLVAQRPQLQRDDVRPNFKP